MTFNFGEGIADRVKWRKRRSLQKDDSNNNGQLTQVFTVNRPIVLLPNEAIKTIQGKYTPKVKPKTNILKNIITIEKKSVQTQTERQIGQYRTITSNSKSTNTATRFYTKRTTYTVPEPLIKKIKHKSVNECKVVAQKFDSLRIHDELPYNFTSINIKKGVRHITGTNSNPNKPKIPRPANAFMLFANENRKKVAKQFPQESNKEISCRLGNQWKCLNPEQKDRYFSMAKTVDAEHKKKYPDYVYNPKEARLRKALRERERTIGAGSGSSQGCIQRARRSPHWATAPGKVLPPAPSHMQHHAAEHLMGGPGKDMRGMQSDFNRGFMNMNGGTGSGYFFSGPQYQINPQSDYPAYIVSPNGWMPNGYVQNNAMMQQQFWNQYQAERMRVHQQSQGSAYMMQPEEPQYQHVEPLPPAPIIQHPMEPAAKEILTNIENSCSDVSSYLNMNSSNGCSAMSCATNSTNVEVNTPTNVIDVAASCDEAPPSIPEQSQSVSVRSEQDLAGNLNAGGSNTGAEEGNTVEGGSGENAASGFDMQLFEEGSLASISSQELHKSINSANPLRCRDSRKNSGNSLPGFNQAFGSTERGRFQSAPEPIRIGSAESEYLEYYTSYNIKFEQYSKWADQANNATSPPPLLSTDFNKAPEQAENLETKTIEHIPQAHNQKPESLHEPLISPYFSVEALQNKSIQGPSNIQPFSTPFENSFYLEYMAPEFMIPNQENQTAKTDDFPLDFSAQKYFETVPGNFDPGYMTGGFLCEDGFTFIPFPNQPEYTSNYAFQSEYDYIVTDGSKLDMKTEPSGSKIDDNYILDLSKMSEEENDIDQCSAAKFTEVSSRICDELAKII